MVRFSWVLLYSSGLIVYVEAALLHTRGVMLRHDRTEGWLEMIGAVSSDPKIRLRKLYHTHEQGRSDYTANTANAVCLENGFCDA